MAGDYHGVARAQGEKGLARLPFTRYSGAMDGLVRLFTTGTKRMTAISIIGIAIMTTCPAGSEVSE